MPRKKQPSPESPPATKSDPQKVIGKAAGEMGLDPQELLGVLQSVVRNEVAAQVKEATKGMAQEIAQAVAQEVRGNAADNGKDGGAKAALRDRLLARFLGGDQPAGGGMGGFGQITETVQALSSVAAMFQEPYLRGMRAMSDMMTTSVRMGARPQDVAAAASEFVEAQEKGIKDARNGAPR